MLALDEIWSALRLKRNEPGAVCSQYSLMLLQTAPIYSCCRLRFFMNSIMLAVESCIVKSC